MRAYITFWLLCLQLAVMSGHFELGEIIKNHKDSDTGKPSCQTLLNGQNRIAFQCLPESVVWFSSQFSFFLLDNPHRFNPLSSCHSQPFLIPHPWPPPHLEPHHHPSHLHPQCPFWSHQSMFPSERRVLTPCLSPYSTPTRYCAPTAITPWPSLTLRSRPPRPQPIPN